MSKVAVAILLDDAESIDVARKIHRFLETQGGGNALVGETTDDSARLSVEDGTPKVPRLVPASVKPIRVARERDSSA